MDLSTGSVTSFVFSFVACLDSSCATLSSNIDVADLSCSKSYFIWINCSSLLLVKRLSNADMPMLISSGMTALNAAIVAADISSLEIGSWTSVVTILTIKSEG